MLKIFSSKLKFILNQPVFAAVSDTEIVNALRKHVIINNFIFWFGREYNFFLFITWLEKKFQMSANIIIKMKLCTIGAQV